MVSSWLSGYGGYSQIPWVRVPQLPCFLYSPFSLSRLSSNEIVINVELFCSDGTCITFIMCLHTLFYVPFNIPACMYAYYADICTYIHAMTADTHVHSYVHSTCVYAYIRTYVRTHLNVPFNTCTCMCVWCLDFLQESILFLFE